MNKRILIIFAMIILLIICGYCWYKNIKNNHNDGFMVSGSNHNKKITGIIQIGAHTGEEASKHYESVKNNMIWIEAQPDKYKELKKHIEQYEQKAIQALIWNESNLIKDFYITNNSVSSSILEPYKHIETFGDPVKVKEVIKLKTITYIDLINKHPELIDPIYNFLILDCQGAEYEVLQSIGKENIQQFDKIEVEISNNEEYKNQKQQPDITKLLKKYGYKCNTNCNNTEKHGISTYLKM